MFQVYFKKRCKSFRNHSIIILFWFVQYNEFLCFSLACN
jgi:hypothetical protein